jgi:hypothetical protein
LLEVECVKTLSADTHGHVNNADDDCKFHLKAILN